MSARLEQLAARRQALIAEAARQRAVAAAATEGIRRSLRFIERAVLLVRHVKRKPLAAALVAAGVALVIRKPGTALRWLGYGLRAYWLVRRARSMLQPRMD